MRLFHNLLLHSFIFILCVLLVSCKRDEQQDEEWISLFNGKDLSNWNANENQGSFKVVDGVIVANGLRSHLFYTGDGTEPVNFKNFELSCDIMTYHLANSGIYFHTAHQAEGWLDQGYEVQVNGTHRGADGYKEVKKGGSLYGIRNLYKAYVPDSVWYNLNVRVEGKRIRVKVNDTLVVDYTEPANLSRFQDKKRLSKGTIALQGHDPESTVFFKNIRLKKLPDDMETPGSIPAKDVDSVMIRYQANHFAFIDLNIDAGNNFNIDSAMTEFYNTGINLGVVTGGTQPTNVIEGYRKYPVFVGLRLNASAVVVDKENLSKFDYIIGEVDRFAYGKGKEFDFRDPQSIPNKASFMDGYVDAIIKLLEEGDIDILSSASALPASISAQYETLWTPERMQRVIEAAKRNNVAIEINSETRTPSMAFLKLAKENGCQFSLSKLYREGSMVSPDYFYEVIQVCKLDYKDVYIPGNPN